MLNASERETQLHERSGFARERLDVMAPVHERKAPQWIDIAPIPRVFAPEALRPLHNLNRRLLDIVVDEWRRGSSVASIAVLGEQLASLDDEILWRLARVPVSLVDAEFRCSEAWYAVTIGTHSDHEVSESPLPRARALELAGLTFGLAATTARASWESARLMFGMRPAVADAFADFTVDLVQWLGQSRAHWVRPRWYDLPQEWCRLIATAEHAEIARLPPVSIRAVNRLLADLEPATCVEAETRHSRR